MKRDFVKIAVALLFSGFFLWSDFDAFNKFMHGVNLGIHEVGHIVFRPFGEFIYIAGGSLFQTLVPIFCAIYFFYRGELFSSAIVLLWVGNNFFDVAIYANDAVFMELPLWSWTGNDETTIHDWNYLLSTTHMLAKTSLIAGIIKGIGVVITIFGICGAFYFARKEENN